MKFEYYSSLSVYFKKTKEFEDGNGENKRLCIPYTTMVEVVDVVDSLPYPLEQRLVICKHQNTFK